MDNFLFFPQQINVGYQNNQETYSGKLACLIYFDHNNKLKKNKSWDSWKDPNIPNTIIDNTPTSGFVLNNEVAGRSGYWNNTRRSYVRVHDPRGFEFEITPQNLMYILENTSSHKGKGLEGDFVYGWVGSELILVPVGDPRFIEYQNYSNSLFEKKHIKVKDLKIGFEYKFKDGTNVVYMGKHHIRDVWSGVSAKSKFIFYLRGGFTPYDEAQREYFIDKSTIPSGLIASEITDEKVHDYLDILSELDRDKNILNEGVSWIDPNDFKIGHKYELSKGFEGIYMGKFHTITDTVDRNRVVRTSKTSNDKEHIFYTPDCHYLRCDAFFTNKIIDAFGNKELIQPQYSFFLKSDSGVNLVLKEIDNSISRNTDYEYYKKKLLEDQWIAIDEIQEAS